MEIACGFGLCVSPTLGEIMYHQMGYKGPFILLGSMFFVFFLVCKLVIPPEMDTRFGDVANSIQDPGGYWLL